VEGIYRVSGFADDVQSLKSKFESEWDQMERILSQCEDIHVITGVLKLYFRLLPIPLITYDAYPHFLAAISKNTAFIIYQIYITLYIYIMLYV
jgi:hypothetical protein